MAKKENKRKENKKKRKYLKYIIILLIILIILIIVLTLLLKSDEEDVQDTVNIIATNEDAYIPMFSEGFIQKYNGDVGEDEIYTALSNFAYYLVDNINEINSWTSNEMSKVYSKNQNMYIEMGLIDEENFIEVMTFIQSLKVDSLSFSYSAFETDTIEIESSGISSEISLKYLELDEFRLNLFVPYNNDDGYVIKITAI